MSDRSPAGRSAGTRSLPGTPALALGAVVVCGLACAGLALGGPRDARTWVQAVAIGYGVLLVAAVTWAGSMAHRGRAAAARLADADSRTAELRRRIAQSDAYIDGHQRRVAQMAAEADAVGAELIAARAESERLRGRLEELGADAAVLVEQAIPEMVGRLGAGASAGTALAGAPALADPRHRRVLEVFTGELANGSRLRAATLAACANAASRVQALTTTMMADLREMENRYDQEVLGDLLKLDHATAQTGRLADSIAVLTGGRSGRRWTKPIVMESILRGAIGRISAYQRVRLHSTSKAAVVGHAAEGVMHALAELVDNATRFSPPTETVHIYVEELTTGVVITVEDAGLVMSPPALRRAQHAVSHDPLRLGTLSGTRLGLAVVGGVAGKYGLTVNFRPSSRGGTGVLLLIPQHLITRPREDPEGSAASRQSGEPRTGAPAGSGPAASGEPVIGPGGLPMRQAGQAARGTRTVPAPPRPPRGAPGPPRRPAPRQPVPRPGPHPRSRPHTSPCPRPRPRPRTVPRPRTSRGPRRPPSPSPRANPPPTPRPRRRHRRRPVRPAQAGPRPYPRRRRPPHARAGAVGQTPARHRRHGRPLRRVRRCGQTPARAGRPWPRRRARGRTAAGAATRLA